jgi:antibiotic biosynthesis monooxygenase (ABM) superfamily enzyme
VVVARRVRPGREREFERWVARIRTAAERAPGHLGSESQPPDDTHPGEWVVVYRFASPELLAGWLDSPERAALMTEAAALVEEPIREQVLVEPAGGGHPVTVVMSQRVPGEHSSEFRALHEALLPELARFPGFLRSDLVEPVEGAQSDHVIVFAFDSKAHLDAWLGSERRARWLERITPLVEGERMMNVVGGFAGWFPLTARDQTPRWKQAAVVLVALFPTSLVLTLLRRAVAPDLPLVVGVLVTNVAGIAILTWMLMPALTRRLAAWLRR